MTPLKQASEPSPRQGQTPASPDSDVKGSFVAIKRAAARARQIAAQTGTDLIVVRAGQVVRVSPEQKPMP